MNMKAASQLHSVGTPQTAASYIAALSEELAQMARRNGLDALGYILDMARMEADQIAAGSDTEQRSSA